MGYFSDVDIAVREGQRDGLRFVTVRVFDGWRVWDIRRGGLVDGKPATQVEAEADAEWLNSPEPLAEEPDITPIGED